MVFLCWLGWVDFGSMFGLLISADVGIFSVDVGIGMMNLRV